MENLRIEIGKKIKKLREEKGLSLRKLAAAIDVDPSHISRVENGNEASIKLLEKLAEFFGVEISYFFGNKKEIPEELEGVGVEWITFAKEMEKKDLTPDEIKAVLEVIGKLKK